MRRELPGQIEMLLTDAPPVPEATIEDVEKVVRILTNHVQLSAAEIARELGWVVNENNKRKVRAIARAARPGIVSFPNSAGYKLAKNCTAEEIAACVASWDSIIRDATITKKLFLDLLHSMGG